ncbi:hypothetical protein HW555_010003 [Spodoptera exigua]|uniref:HTH CENPB-type domain-containing protein n=1 Tax=Spodoptera exigua TaxID=7107 RepID=A0A835G9M2_SPOEX|nr:hypothetical protein HW555_010003 [Spodoptera exigua]
MKPSQKKSREKNSKKCLKRKIYTEENLQKALHEISKGMSKKLAAKTFSVPRSTVQFRLKNPDHRYKPGPPTILTDEEEQLFVDWIKISSKKGFPKRKEDLIKSVSDFINKSGRASSFRNGDKWFKLFLARHPTVTFRTPEAVTAASSTVSASDVRGWFEQIRIYMTENSYYDILSDPSRVFNGDETNFVLCPKTDTIEKSLNPSTIINGFRATGLCPFNEDAVDYSKCLGTSNKNNITIAQPKHVTDNRVLTKDDFTKLLGESTIHKIDKRELRPEESSECLLKIWNFFTTFQNDLHNSSKLDTERQNDNIGNFDIENMEIIINNSPNKNVAEQSFDFVSQDVVVEEIVQCSELNYFIEDISTLQERIPETHASILQPSLTYVPNNKQPSTQQTFVQQTSIYQASVSSQQQSSIYSTPQKPSIRVTGDVKISADQNNFMQLKAPLVKEDNKYYNILVLPKTPQRKGIKNTKKTPFVLTSAEWKAQENEKIKIKEEKAEGVKKRKEEREQKKLEKEKKMVKKNKKQTKAKDNVSKMLFSEDFYKLDNDKLEALLKNYNKENQKASTSKNYSAAEIEKMLTETDSDD